MPTDTRLIELIEWCALQLPAELAEINPLASDASFRRYYRLRDNNNTNFIAMDAPTDKEDSRPFIAVAKVFAKLGLTVPTIIAADLLKGFLLISDLGDDLYFRILCAENVDQLYINAIIKLLTIQQCSSSPEWQFPPFSQQLLMEELLRFREWYLLKHLELILTTAEERLLAQSFELLVNLALSQPQVCVHRDYHSRNLLALKNNDVGILDFQDAVLGPITYDLISLIRDCYIAWPQEQVHKWSMDYYHLASEAKLLNSSHDQFIQWLDWMGIQRHLKAIYIFARKFRRDHNTVYLNDIPRTLNYVLTITSYYPEFTELNQFLTERVLPYESYDPSSRPWNTYASAYGQNTQTFGQSR